MRHRLVRKTFEMIEKIAKDEDKQVFTPSSLAYNVCFYYINLILHRGHADLFRELQVEGLLTRLTNVWMLAGLSEILGCLREEFEVRLY
jgi:hypothetical protein